MCREGLLGSFCQPKQKFERATTLEYPMKPLWHIHFVVCSGVLFDDTFIIGIMKFHVFNHGFF
jgi:hypothetical protein